MKNIKRYPLGRKESPLDPRDWDLGTFKAAEELKLQVEEPITSMHWFFRGLRPLYQGDFGHCCGFMDANFLINDPINTPCTDEDGHRFYYMCKVFDGEPLNEEGSNIRSAARVLQQIGRIQNYAFAKDFETIKWWLLHKGPLLLGTVWYEGMFTPDPDGTVHPTGAVAGGHAWEANGIDEMYIYGQNSWGEWGIHGAFRILISDFIKILSVSGEAIAAVELESGLVRKLNIIELIINFIISLFKKGE